MLIRRTLIGRLRLQQLTQTFVVVFGRAEEAEQECVTGCR